MHLLATAGLVALTFVGASYLSTLVHEVLGHYAVGAAVGAELGDVSISFFHGSAHVGTDPGTWQHYAVQLSAMGANILTGVPAMLVARRLRVSTWSMALFMFGAVSLLRTTTYLVIGLYYAAFDPDGLPRLLLSAEAYERYWTAPWDAHRFWVPALILHAVVSWVAARAFLRQLDGRITAARGWRRLANMAACGGPAVLLWFAFSVVTPTKRPDDPAIERRHCGTASAQIMRRIQTESTELSASQAWARTLEEIRARPRCEALPESQRPFRLNSLHLIGLALAVGLGTVAATRAGPKTASCRS